MPIETELSTLKEIRDLIQTPQSAIFAAYGARDLKANHWAMLIDLSDTQNFPHIETGFIALRAVFLSADRDNAGSGTLQIGVVTEINETQAKIKFVQGVNFRKSDVRTSLRDRNFNPFVLDCSVVDGELPKVVSQFSVITEEINSGTELIGPINGVTHTASVGDLLVRVVHEDGVCNVAASCFYQTGS